MDFDVLIVGGGAVGSAIAYRLARYDCTVAVAEKELDVAMGASGHNSAVVHAGFNNRPGSAMARLCVAGSRGFETAARLLDVPYQKTGKLVVGDTDADRAALIALIETGTANGCAGLRLIGADEIRALEPGVSAKWAMLSPETAIIDPFLYNIHLAEAAVQNGAAYLLDSPVTGVSRRAEGFCVRAGAAKVRCRVLINAAGLFADRVSAMAGDARYTIYPNRGEYYLFDKMPAGLLRMPIYPVPRPGVGGLGVHLTPTVDGNLIIGPSSAYVDAPDALATTGSMLAQLAAEAQTLLPSLDMRQVIGAYAGMRAKLVPGGAENFGDFVIEESPLVSGLIQLIGIESPGLTASLPIARMVEDMVLGLLPVREKRDFIPEYRGIPRFAALSDAEKARAIARDPEYGDIVCRCETVTKAEVRRAYENPLGARGLIAIKNRVRATMGRCNGGYCLTRMVDMLMHEYGVPPAQIHLKYADDRPFTGHVKRGVGT